MKRDTQAKILKHYRLVQTGSRKTSNNLARTMIKAWTRSNRSDRDILNTLASRNKELYD